MSSLFSRIFAQLASNKQTDNPTDHQTGNQTLTDVEDKEGEGKAGQTESGETKTAPKKPGSVFGSAALIAGTTVGAGVLALPAVTLPVGLLPSTALMLAAWLYMLVSGLLIAEANLQAMRQTGSADVGLLATVRLSLGKRGAIAAGTVYIFIHYALLVAYVARGGDILADAIASFARAVGMVQTVPLWWGHMAFVAIFGGILYGGSKRFTTRLNSVLVIFVVVSFGGLLGLTLEQVDVSRWQFQQWAAVSSAVPVMFVAFVYQNVVPVITTQLAGDVRKIRRSIVIGSLVPLTMFVLWNAVILASVGVETLAVNSNLNSELAAGTVLDPIELLRQGTAHPLLGVAVSVFSEVAIATSFIGFIFGLLDIFEDIFKSALKQIAKRLAEQTVSQIAQARRNIIYGLTLTLPLLLSFTDPNIFFEAIDFAGAFGNSILFGVIPVLVVWKMRNASPPSEPLVPGGKRLLIGVMAIAVGIILQNAWLKASAFLSSL